MIAIGIWFLAFAIFSQPAPLEAYGAQEVKVVGWSTSDLVQVDLKKIGGMTHWVALPIPVTVED